MNVTIVGSASGESDHHQNAISYLINETVAIDAGCLGLLWPFEAQKRVQHVFLSHSHIDHIATLPLFVDNVYEPGPASVTVYASEAVLQALRQDMFNDRVWPDVVRLASEESPFVKFQPIESGQVLVLDGLTITPVAVRHIVPTLGFVIDDGTSAVVLTSDTGPTDAIWEVANRTANVKAVIIEASFPNRMQWLADKAEHLTPATFRGELAKLKHKARVLAVHIKLPFRDEIIGELESLDLPDLEIGVPRKVYEF